jgi:hypothetical protein
MSSYSSQISCFVNSWNSCFHSNQNLLYSCLLYEDIHTKLLKTGIWFFTWLWKLLSYCEEREWSEGVVEQSDQIELWKNLYLRTPLTIDI